MEVWDWRSGRPRPFTSFLLSGWTANLARAFNGSLLIDLKAGVARDRLPGTLWLLSPSGRHALGEDDGAVVLYRLAEPTPSRTTR